MVGLAARGFWEAKAKKWAFDAMPAEEYSASAASVGLQLGAQTRSVLIAFLQQQALDQFRAATGWTAGINGSIALIDVGDSGTLSTDTIKDPMVYFAFDNRGLMFSLSLEGTKFSKIVR